MLRVGLKANHEGQLTVLWRRDQVAFVRPPVDAEDLGAVAFEASPDLDVQALDGLDVFGDLEIWCLSFTQKSSHQVYEL